MATVSVHSSPREQRSEASDLSKISLAPRLSVLRREGSVQLLNRVVTKLRAPVYLVFTIALSVACYLRPIAGDFDRYVYESLVRVRFQSIPEIYDVVKHESPRAQASTVLDSPSHLAQLMPLYAIRPIYVATLNVISDAGLSIQQSISLVSAASAFVIAWVLALATRNYLGSAAVIAMPGVLEIARSGGPDALSSLFVVSGCLLALREKLFPAVVVLLISVWVRTDNVLIALAVLAWLVWEKKLGLRNVIVLAILSVASVEWINFWSGNYGLKVLFYYSFIGGRYPGQLVPLITVRDYLRISIENAQSVVPQLAPWILLAMAAWHFNSQMRRFMFALITACITHYLLFPSPEGRYFAWAYLMVGAMFVSAIRVRRQLPLRSERQIVVPV